MKVAVIIIGRIDYLNKSNRDLNLNLLKGSDIFLHSDFEYRKEGMKLKPRDFIFTKSSQSINLLNKYKSKYKVLTKKLTKLASKNNKYYNPNFERILQWWRYNECINEFNLDEYDYIIKWRTDSVKVVPKLNDILSNLVEIYGSLKGYIAKQTFNKEHLYMFRDLFFLGSPETFKKLDFYSNIDDFIGEENEKIHYDKALVDKCDTKSGRFHWLEYGDRPFLHLFSSETSMIKKALSENIIIKDILK